MRVVVHFWNRYGAEKFAREMVNDGAVIERLMQAWAFPKEPFRFEDQPAKFRIVHWAKDASGDMMHFIAIHAIPLH